MKQTLNSRRHFLGQATAIGVAAALPGCAVRVPLATGEHVQSFSGVVSKRVSLRYLMWVPEAASRPAGGWPLMIFLHGSGERGSDLARVKMHGPPKYAAAGRPFPFILVAPQVPEGMAWDSDGLEALRADLVARLPIDPERVVLTGMSMGGYGTWNYAVDYPDRLAAIAPVCGSGDSDRAERIVHLPVWAFHGALDNVVPPAGDQEMVTAVNAAGGQAKFTLYPDVGHNAWDPAYVDPALYAWLMAQRRGRAARD